MVVNKYPLHFKFNWFLKDLRPDPDNISFNQKFIFDGMKNANVIRDDKLREVSSFEHHFFLDRSDPRVEIMFWHVEGNIKWR